jgi:hypothetical protein
MSVYLQNVNLSTSGKYRCEISAEAPSFNTAAAEDYLVINGTKTHCLKMIYQIKIESRD